MPEQVVSTMTKTPQTTPPRHNYANPHTPIASVKRPRQSLETGKKSLTPRRSSELSPLHPPKPVENDHDSWVSRKVDGLFAPVLNFLHEQSPAESSLANTPESIVPTTTSESDDDEDSMMAIEGTDLENEDEFNPWQFIKSLPDYQLVRHLCPPVALPPKNQDAPELTLVLDLDETLVHCSVEPVHLPDFTFPVEFHNATYTVYAKQRPHLQEFLRKIHGKYEIVIFTASQKVYANELLNLIDPERKFFHHRLFRESCLAVEGNFLKDLNVLGRDLSKTILVDNSPHAFGYQVDNGIPIESWFEEVNDRELLKLERFLRSLLGKPHDVREAIREKFQCHELVRNAKLF